jgi:hypothetical protein
MLTSCGTSQHDIDSAKQELLWNTKKTEDITTPMPSESVEKANSLVQIIPRDENRFLEFDSISENSLQTGEVIITGTTNILVDSIEVLFTNPTSKYPDDDYTLKAFMSGDESFKYIASSKNQVLDFGQNEYIFRASSGKQVSETKIILEVLSDDEKEKIGTESNLIWVEDNLISINLPTSSKYGEPMKLGEASFTYTQIKGFEINKEILEIVSCESLTDYLSGRINVWYYWNTCRDIVKDEWIKFNVIRLEWDTYIYERHYIDFIHGFYGTYELELGEGVTSANIADKNAELKQREFPSLDIVDGLMKDIVNS